jgi:hypothetical protein
VDLRIEDDALVTDALWRSFKAACTQGRGDAACLLLIARLLRRTYGRTSACAIPAADLGLDDDAVARLVARRVVGRQVDVDAPIGVRYRDRRVELIPIKDSAIFDWGDPCVVTTRGLIGTESAERTLTAKTARLALGWARAGHQVEGRGLGLITRRCRRVDRRVTACALALADFAGEAGCAILIAYTRQVGGSDFEIDALSTVVGRNGSHARIGRDFRIVVGLHSYEGPASTGLCEAYDEEGSDNVREASAEGHDAW